MSQMTQNSFAELSLCGATQRAISEVLRYETMTKVQVHAIPPALAGAFRLVFATYCTRQRRRK